MVKILLAAMVVFIAWSALDFVIHGVILEPTYQATAHLWRPEGEMKMGLMFFTTLVSAFVFSLLYGKLICGKSTKTGLLYGLLIGLAFGISMGYGTYSVMPIPYSMALTWFLGSLVETTTGGLLVGLIVK